MVCILISRYYYFRKSFFNCKEKATYLRRAKRIHKFENFLKRFPIISNNFSQLVIRLRQSESSIRKNETEVCIIINKIAAGIKLKSQKVVTLMS